MTVDEFLLQNKSVLKTMVINGIGLDLGRCAGMLQVYESEKAKHGHRHALTVCKEKYSLLSERTAFRILKKLRNII